MSRKVLALSLVLGISLTLFGLFSYMCMLRISYPSLDDPLVETKLEPWFWDKLKLLEANGTTRFYAIIICVNCRGYEDRKEMASFLVEKHNATHLYIADVLDFITLEVRVPEVKKIALYDFVELIGDGERKGTWAD